MDVIKDERFASVIKDPRFKKIPTKHLKTQIDKRFHGLFTDKRFELQYKVDKRGSPLDCKISEDYKKFYQLDNDEKDEKEQSDSSGDDVNKHEDDADQKHSEDVEAQDVKAEHCSSDENDNKDCIKDVDEDSDDEADVDIAINIKKNESRPLDMLGSEDGSTSTDTEASDIEQEEEIVHQWQELDADAPRTSDITRRLAVCNMDWDRLCAEDFYVVFNSFKPADGAIHSIKIYPSEYGLERMEKEKTQGPADLIEEKLDDTEDGTDSGKSLSSFHREKLRQYQINRLKYFFAVVECDSSKTADTLYEQLNGTEFESSGCILDLRFIPDDMSFEQEPVSVASSFTCPVDYKPRFFVNSALNQVKVDLTWDETDPRREEILKKAFTEPENIENDIKQYLASPSESEDEEEELDAAADCKKLSSKEAIAKYKALLQSLEEKEKAKQNEEEECDMEITWDSGLKEKTQELVKKKIQSENLTPFEEQLQKQKELKKQKKEKKLKFQKESSDINSSDDSDPEENYDDEYEQKSSRGQKKKKKNRSPDKIEVDKKKIAELTLLVAEHGENDSSESDDLSSEKKKKNKRKKKKPEVKKADDLEPIDDPRFAELYTSSVYHIDPSKQNFKERKAREAVIQAMQRNKKSSSNPVDISQETSMKKDNFFESVKNKTCKSIKEVPRHHKVIEGLKEKKLKQLEIQRNSNLHKGAHSTFVGKNESDHLTSANHSKKRKKQQQQQKIKRQDFRRVNFGDEIPSESTVKNRATWSEDDDNSDVFIYSSSSTNKHKSTQSSATSQHVHSVRKKAKKFRTS